MMENLPLILIAVGLVLLVGIRIADRRALKRDDQLLDIPEDIYDEAPESDDTVPTRPASAEPAPSRPRARPAVARQAPVAEAPVYPPDPLADYPEAEAAYSAPYEQDESFVPGLDRPLPSDDPRSYGAEADEYHEEALPIARPVREMPLSEPLREPTAEELARHELDFPLDDTLDNEARRFDDEVEQAILEEYERERGPSTIDTLTGLAGRLTGNLKQAAQARAAERAEAKAAAAAAAARHQAAESSMALDDGDPLLDAYDDDQAFGYQEPRYQPSNRPAARRQVASHAHASQPADQPGEPHSAELADSGQSYELPEIQNSERILSLYVAANPGETFDGERIKALFAHRNYEYGKRKIFHSLHNGKVIFSIANMVEPGYFELGDMNNMQTPGIALFACLPGPLRDDGVFDVLLKEAYVLNQHLGGRLLDESRSTLTKQTLYHLREELTLAVQARERKRQKLAQEAEANKSRGLLGRRSKPKPKAPSRSERLKDRV